MSLSRWTTLAIASAALVACKDAPTGTSYLNSAPRLAVNDGIASAGEYELCKAGGSSGTFDVTYVSPNGAPPLAPAVVTLAPGECQLVLTANDPSGIGYTTTVTERTMPLSITATTEAGASVPASGNSVTYFVNRYHGIRAVYTNPTPPPTPVCDFVTFGRLVTTVNGQKVVVSGNAGGNQPGGGILGEFHVEVNGVDNHVSDVATYGPITSGVLSGAAYPNARMFTGTAKNGNAIEVRVYDNGEPGKGSDYIYVTVNGVVVINQVIDQGNIQYHANCRGPG